MIIYICIILFLLNLIFIYLLNRKKIKKFFYRSNIEEISVSNINSVFNLKIISQNLKGPKKDAIIKSFCISPENDIVGMTSDYEAWVISNLSKISKNIFEFGTCSGKTTYLMALNSNKDTKITTLTLNSDETSELEIKSKDNKVSYRNMINESIYNKFLFSGEEVSSKIEVIFENSMTFNHHKYKNMIDLIFIDGGHTYSVVKNDSEKSFDMLSENGIILWHDYVPGKKSASDVVRYLNQISKQKKIFSIKNTSLCFYKKNFNFK